MSTTSSAEALKQEQNVWNIIKTWFLNSPSHGIRRISLATTLFGRIFWAATFLIFTTLMCVFIHTVIIKYVSNPTKINLSVRQYHESITFPAVTFCNLNPLRDASHLDNDIDPNEPIDPMADYTESEYRYRFIEYMYRLLLKKLNQERVDTISSGYQLNDLLIQCTFNGRLCHRNLTSFFHPNYGNCYTFNDEEHVETVKRNSSLLFWSVDDGKAEHVYKLYLELYLYQNEYIQYLDDRAAFRIFIHGKHQVPILSHNSLFLSPGTFSHLIFSQRIMYFSHKCRTNLTDYMKEITNSDNVTYSQALCFKLCEFRFIEKTCYCTDPLLMVFYQFFPQNFTNRKQKYSSCSLQNKCLENRNHFNSTKHCPECLPDCKLIQYKTQSSYADYPNIRSTEKTFQRVENHLKGNGASITNLNTSACSNNRKGTLRENIVAVEISASPFATEILRESPMYTWIDVISSIGGQTGLWIGISLISFVEIAELFFLLLCHGTKLIYRNMVYQLTLVYQRVFLGKISSKL